MVAVCAISFAQAQGQFQNLDFELANVAGYSPGATVPIGSALPEWQALYASASSSGVLNTVEYDILSLGGAALSINDAGTGPGFTPLEGNFSAFLFGGDDIGQSSITISQSGLVPSDSLSIQMLVRRIPGGQHNGPFVVRMNGQQISMLALESFPTYVLYGGDISSFAGQVATLSITALPVAFAPNMVCVDDILFSPVSVPEPSVLGLVCIGLLGLGWYLQQKT